MYSIFCRNPTKESLNTIIDNCKKTILNAAINIKGNGISTELANTYMDYYLSPEHSSNLIDDNKVKIDNLFKEILNDVEIISKSSITEEGRAMYINIIESYSKKIMSIYKL